MVDVEQLLKSYKMATICLGVILFFCIIVFIAIGTMPWLCIAGYALTHPDTSGNPGTPDTSNNPPNNPTPT